MMEDADGYNQIWTAMMLVFPEVTGTTADLHHPAVTELLANFAAYIGPDDEVFQYTSGLSPHYTGLDWVAMFERAAQLTGNGAFRFAARRVYSAMLLKNQTLASLVKSPSQGSLFWASTYGLICGNRRPGEACGGGWANPTLGPVPPSDYDTPTSVVHRRREPGVDTLPDKIVMAQSKAFRSNRTFVTLAAHTGSTLYHSHSVDTGQLVNFWHGGARFLGGPGKHDMSADHGNGVVLQRSRDTSRFPQRGVGDMFTPGEVSTMMLPVRTHLPMLDQAGPGFLTRNFSALGFSCSNFLNHTINVTFFPLLLRGDDKQVLLIDAFTASTAHLWASSARDGGVAEVVPDSRSQSGYALRLVCAANTTGCGPIPKSGACPDGCVIDHGWCESTATSFVNRKPTVPGDPHALPTEHSPSSTIDVRNFSAFNLQWAIDAGYRQPVGPPGSPNGGGVFPVGMQTTTYAPFSNKTYHYFGNEVKTLLGIGSDSDPIAIQTKIHPNLEVLGDGEYWPNVSFTHADVQGNDLQSMIVIGRGFHDQHSSTTRQVFALAEGPVVVIDTVTLSKLAGGFTGGPSWAVVAGGDTSGEIHHKEWPAWWSRPNMTGNGTRWVAFTGFQQLYNPVPTLSDRRLLVVLPELEGDGSDGVGSKSTVGFTESMSTPGACAEQLCPLYPAWYVHQTRQLQALTRTSFVSVLVPHGPEDNAAAIAASVTAKIAPSESGTSPAAVGVVEPDTTTTVTVSLADGNGGRRNVLLAATVADKHTDEPLAWSVKRQ